MIIDGKRILTNAHVVLYASQIFVQANQSTERVPAKVQAMAPGVDLAIVEVEKPAFFDGRPPLPLADGIPAMKQTVSVYGYPIGGEQLSVTQGIVSRIEYTAIYCLISGLRIQIDAALEPRQQRRAGRRPTEKSSGWSTASSPRAKTSAT